MVGHVIRTGVGTAVVLLAEHAVLYERIERTEAYAVGVGTIGGGLAAYALVRPEANAGEMVAAFSGIALISGAAVKAAYLVRGQLASRDRLAMAAGLTAGLGLKGGERDGTDKTQRQGRAGGNKGVGIGRSEA